MSNVSITSRCNASCDYCFSGDVLAGHGSMSIAAFKDILRSLHGSGAGDIRFLGGEPSLNPALPEMVAAVLGNNLRAVIFTNGRMPPPIIDALGDLRCERLLFVLNASVQFGAGKNSNSFGDRFLERFAPYTMPGITVARRGQDLSVALDMIEAHGLLPCVRIGLGHPAPGNHSRFLHQKFYRDVGIDVAGFIGSALERGVRVEFDCGFVPCMFDGLCDKRKIRIPRDLGRRCNPLPDFLPDGSAVACFPLAAQAGSIVFDAKKSIGDYQEEFSRRLTPLRNVGIFPACSECAHRVKGECFGGCRAAAIRRLLPRPAEDCRIQSGRRARVTPCASSATPREAASAQREKRRWVIPYIDQAIPFWERVAGQFGPWIKAVYFPLPGANHIGSGRPVQAQGHLRDFLRFPDIRRSVIVNPIVLPHPTEKVIPGIVEQVRDLFESGCIDEATVSNLHLATALRRALPRLRLTASTLLDIFTPLQMHMIKGIFDSVVASSRIVRDRVALSKLKTAGDCAVRIIVNEGCLPGCPFRTQHFYEMCSGADNPRSLCDELLARTPWLRLTGAWILPQHLHLVEGLYDDVKIAGRVTLADPGMYIKVLAAYVKRTPLMPHEIGGGPASVLEPKEIDASFFENTLTCHKACSTCATCRSYYGASFPESNLSRKGSHAHTQNQ